MESDAGLILLVMNGMPSRLIPATSSDLKKQTYKPIYLRTMKKPISEYTTDYDYAEDYGKVPEFNKQREKLRKTISDLDHEIYTEMRLMNERWHGYKLLKESSYESENKDWNGEEDDECRKMTGDCFEIWHSIANANADFMQKAGIEHARKLVVADDKRIKAEKDSKNIWDKEWKERAKGRDEWNKYQEKNKKEEVK